MAAARKTKRKAASMTKKTASLFEEIERSGVPDSDISHWNSDLYLRVTRRRPRSSTDTSSRTK